MHPSLLSAKRHLEDVEIAFRRLEDIEAEVIEHLPDTKSATEAKTILRASQIEDIYTGMERTLKDLLKAVDKLIYGAGPSWHKNLLLQAASRNDLNERGPIMSEALFQHLDNLRAFRNAVRSNYGFGLRHDDVNRNEDILIEAVAMFRAEVNDFLTTYEPPSDGTRLPGI